MNMSIKEQSFADILLSVITGVAGVSSTMDNIEQVGRIILLFISILSALILCIINFDKAWNRIKSFFK
jgi:hypothetical protein